MYIKIIETGKIEELEIIDPRTEIEWTQDLLGNYDALGDYDEDADAHLMSQSDFEWWSDFITEYQKAVIRLNSLVQELRFEGKEQAAEELQAAAHDISSEDLESFPAILNQICDEKPIFR